jgi:hypothetical protein
MQKFNNDRHWEFCLANYPTVVICISVEDNNIKEIRLNKNKTFFLGAISWKFQRRNTNMDTEERHRRGVCIQGNTMDIRYQIKGLGGNLRSPRFAVQFPLHYIYFLTYYFLFHLLIYSFYIPISLIAVFWKLYYVVLRPCSLWALFVNMEIVIFCYISVSVSQEPTSAIFSA